MKKGLFLLLIAFSPLLEGQEKEEVDILDLSDLDLESENVKLEDLEEKKRNTEDLKIEEIIEPTSEYRYASFGKEDPFVQPAFTLPDKPKLQPGLESPASSEIPMLSPLQAYPLEQLEVKGVWILPSGEARAVIMTPKKEGVIVKQEDPISAGKVMEIRRDKLIVRQYKLRADGSREFTDIDLFIGKPEDRALGTIRLQPGKPPTFERVNEVQLENEGPGGRPPVPGNGNVNSQGGEQNNNRQQVDLQEIDPRLPPEFPDQEAQQKVNEEQQGDKP